MVQGDVSGTNAVAKMMCADVYVFVSLGFGLVSGHEYSAHVVYIKQGGVSVVSGCISVSMRRNQSAS